MSSEVPNTEAEVTKTLEMLKRPDLSLDSVILLGVRLLELCHPGKKVVLTDSDSIEIVEPDGKKTRIFLHNLRSECQQSPEERVEIVQKYLRIMSSTPNDDDVSIENIVAITRDAEYRAFVNEEQAESLTQHLCGDFWIVYAIDRSDSTSVLSMETMKKLGLSQPDLYRLGTANISGLLLNMEIDSYGELHILNSDNAVYLSSALLLDHVWEHAASMVKGDIVVAVPARDTVVFTGSSSSEGLRLLREEVISVFENGHHLVSRTLLRRHEGRWSVFS